MTAWTDQLRKHLRPAYRGTARRLPLRLQRRFMYAVSVGAPLRLRSPRRFTEKVNWRIVHDRRPGIAERCDKMRMKDIAAATVTDGSLRIPRTLWHGTDLADVPENLWDGAWVLKPNHGSGDVIFSPEPGSPEADVSVQERVADLRRRTRTWLNNPQAEDLGEWGYAQARHEILLEERLPVDGAPDDYKLYCFDGEPCFTMIASDRFGPNKAMTFFDVRDGAWERQEVRVGTSSSPDQPRPAQLPTMLEIARKLSAGWDFMRVDLYAIGDELWFGELTPYSSGGTGHYHPIAFDLHMGSFWNLPDRREVERP